MLLEKGFSLLEKIVLPLGAYQKRLQLGPAKFCEGNGESNFISICVTFSYPKHWSSINPAQIECSMEKYSILPIFCFPPPLPSSANSQPKELLHLIKEICAKSTRTVSVRADVGLHGTSILAKEPYLCWDVSSKSLNSTALLGRIQHVSVKKKKKRQVYPHAPQKKWINHTQTGNSTAWQKLSTLSLMNIGTK
jgi:hypothetical protein